MTNKNKIKLDDNLIFVLALYEDGSFQRGNIVDKGFVMLIDIGRWRNTIMSNPKTTPDAIYAYGYYWEKYDRTNEGDYMVIDDDFIVHHGVQATNEDFKAVQNNEYAGILLEGEGSFTYMNRKGDFFNI